MQTEEKNLWEATLFEAASDARDQIAWPRSISMTELCEEQERIASEKIVDLKNSAFDESLKSDSLQPLSLRQTDLRVEEKKPDQSCAKHTPGDWHQQCRILCRLLLILFGNLQKGKEPGAVQNSKKLEKICTGFQMDLSLFSQMIASLSGDEAGYMKRGQLILFFITSLMAKNWNVKTIYETLLSLGFSHGVWGRPFVFVRQDNFFHEIQSCLPP